MHFTKASLLALAGLAAAQSRPANEPICDYYTTALLKDNTPANQLKLLTLVVNTALIGNYTMPNVGVAVPGILTPGMYMGTPVSLAKYFDGSLLSTNDNGKAVSMSFLDGGGAAPLMKSMPASDTTSNQYHLLTHLYSYFGILLGCTGVGKDGFPAYGGDASQASVHRFMALDQNEVGYFIEQVGLSASSFGVTDADVKAAGGALTKTFDYRCSPPTLVVQAQGKQLQSICQANTCPLDPMATCSAYPAVVEPAMASPSASMYPTPAPTSSSAPAPAAPVYTGAASSVVSGPTGILGSIFAALMLL